MLQTKEVFSAIGAISNRRQDLQSDNTTPVTWSLSGCHRALVQSFKQKCSSVGIYSGQIHLNAGRAADRSSGKPSSVYGE